MSACYTSCRLYVQLVLLILVFLAVYYSLFHKVALLHARHNADPFSKFSFLDGKYKVGLAVTYDIADIFRNGT